MVNFKERIAPKNYFKERSYGFYVTLGIVLFSVVTAIVYAALYGDTPRFMAWSVFVSLIVGAVVALACTFLRLDQLAPAALALTSLIALLRYIRVIYNYVVVVLVGIDVDSFEPRFIASMVLLSILLVASIADIFLKQSKEKRV